MFEYLEKIILGFVQGLTEFLPVSSSGHLKIFQSLFGYNPESDLFVSIMLHLGTLVAVFICYYKLIGSLIKEFFGSVKDICTGKFSWKGMNSDRRMMFMVIIATSLLVFMIIPFGKYSLKDYIEMVNGVNSLIPVGICLVVTGILLLVSHHVAEKGKFTHKDATVKDTLIVGATQCVATLSGISRSGSTVAAGLLCGLSREYMVRFTFILSIPTILAAAASDAGDAFSGKIVVDAGPLVAGIISAIVFGILSIKFIEWLIKKNRYNLFGYYCAAIGVAVIFTQIFFPAAFN